MNLKFYTKYFNARIFLVIILLCGMIISKSQFYSYTKTTATYTELTGATSLINTNWDDFSVKFKTPFVFRFFTSNINDSIEVVDWGGIYFNNINNGYFDVYKVDLNSRGVNKSPVTYKTEGSTPSRILKIQFHNAGFKKDGPGFTDSVNFQLWIYETSYIIEFRYGPNSVKQLSYDGENGPYVQIADPLTIVSNFITLEGDPTNPTPRYTGAAMATTLNGSPPDGTLYRFTPSAFHSGINHHEQAKINIIQNKISLPAGMEVQQIEILNMNGQIVQSVKNTNQVDFSNLAKGVYVIVVNTNQGVLKQKLIL